MGARCIVNSRLFLAAIAAIASLLLSPAAAQLPPGGLPTGNPRDRATEDRLRSDELERVKRNAELVEDRDTARRFPSIKEDFEQIQLINNDVLQARAAAAPDYRQIAAAADEIKQRAGRLKGNLFATAAERHAPAKGPNEPQEHATKTQDLRSLLAALDKVIHSFVSNPMFTNLKVLDVERSAEAKRDLEQIIRLSARLNKEADKLRKAADH